MAFLTRQELRDLTGCAVKDKMIETLKSNHVPFFVRYDGWPAVTWEAVNGTLMTPAVTTETAPNFGYLKQH